MILSFSVSNFRSFDKEVTISAVASKRVQNEHEQHLVSIPGTDEKALPILVLYGANGAGKSNLIKALSYLRTLAMKLNPVDGRTGRITYFGQEEASTELDLMFMAGGSTYRYGLTLNSSAIQDEWLIRIEGPRETEIFERRTTDGSQVQVQIGDEFKKYERFKSLAVVGCRANQTFLATIISTLEDSDQPTDLRVVVEWLQLLGILGPQSGIPNLPQVLEKESKLREFASSLLRNFSTGVDRIDALKRPLSRDQVRAEISAERLSDAERLLSADPGIGFVAAAPDGTQIAIENIEPWQAHHYSIRSVHTKADGSDRHLNLDDESDGTRRLLHLAPALFQLSSQPAIFVIDELDRSLHPILLYAFLETYLREPNPHACQLIVTTHESHLLDTALLRRDEIWFVEKDKGGATTLYSLSDFQVRKDLSIRKHYLQGRFGAIPFLGDPGQLLPESSEA